MKTRPPGAAAPAGEFPRPRRSLLAHSIADSVAEAIATGHLGFGERVVETALADKYEVSRVPVREALKVLATQGILVGGGHRGYRVATFSPEKIEQVREDLLEAQQRGERPNLQSEAVASVGVGDVLVVGMGGETRTAFMGDVMTTHLLAKGAAAAVLDGAVSDAAAISEIPFPVFCTGNAATPLTSHRLVVEIGGAIDCAGVPVLPGDVIMGDANGVAAIPAHVAAEVAEACAERELLEEFVIERVRAGAPLAGAYPPDEATLAAFRDWRAEHGR